MMRGEVDGLPAADGVFARAAFGFQVLLGDADGVYDPANFNDRLLLKGTMSEAELRFLRARLH